MFKILFAVALLSMGIVAHANASPVVAINAGSSSAVGSFQADMQFSGGSVYANPIPINRASVMGPADEAVYQSVRFGSFSYLLSGLEPGKNFTVRLHMAEIFWNSPGARLFNVFVNSTPALTNFDIFTAAGGKGIAIVKEVTAQADGLGKILIEFASLVDNAQVNGIEVLAIPTPPPFPIPPLFKLEANQPSYEVGQSASLVVHYLAAPESPEFEYFSTSTLDGVALPVTNTSRNYAVAVTPILETVGLKAWNVSVYLQNRQLAQSLNDTVDFLLNENFRIDHQLEETTDPDTIASLEKEKARNLLLIERAQAELAAGRRPVGILQTLNINVL